MPDPQGQGGAQPQVRLSLSKLTEMLPSGSRVMCITSWEVMLDPSEPVTCSENVKVWLAFCWLRLKLPQTVSWPVRVALVPWSTALKLSSSVNVPQASSPAGNNVT